MCCLRHGLSKKRSVRQWIRSLYGSVLLSPDLILLTDSETGTSHNIYRTHRLWHTGSLWSRGVCVCVCGIVISDADPPGMREFPLLAAHTHDTQTRELKLMYFSSSAGGDRAEWVWQEVHGGDRFLLGSVEVWPCYGSVYSSQLWTSETLIVRYIRSKQVKLFNIFIKKFYRKLIIQLSAHVRWRLWDHMTSQTLLYM